MNNNLLFDFQVDKTSKTVCITREFEAEQSLVWAAFTTPELLDQWVAPKPFTARTKYMDFKVGGKRFYAMVSPEGMERWAVQEYTLIDAITHFKMLNNFADENENKVYPGSEWDYKFEENSGITKVTITIYNESLERMELLLETGFREGFTMTIGNLENLLISLKQ
jgi:uncharacterized protein YndB with AHSA1/START domain